MFAIANKVRQRKTLAGSRESVLIANCYRCGRPTDDTHYHLRRRVKSGEHERRPFSSPRSHMVQTHCGMRIVCKRCAWAIDRQNYHLTIEGHLQVIVVLVIVLLLNR
jgi:hypothetical protein